MTPNEMVSILKDIIDVEYREYHPSVRDSYICGFQNSENISIRISFGDKNLYEIEVDGHILMRTYADNSKDTFDSYLFILNDIIDSLKRMKKQCYAFPKYTVEDNRTQKIDKLLK